MHSAAPLIAISPGNMQGHADIAPFLRRLDGALAAGLPAVLLREQQLCAADLLELATQAAALCANRDQRQCIVHDSLHVAVQSGASGVHLGFRSLTPAVAREVAGDTLRIGFSAHAGDGAQSWQGADYVFYGPVHPTPSKQGLKEPVGVRGLAEFCQANALPVYGLGGLTPEGVADCCACGAGVAVLSGIFGAPDAALATSRYLQAFDR